jgi:hypothetical protein
MSYSVNHVTKWEVTWHDTRFSGLFKNILHFRGIESSISGVQLKTYIEGDFASSYISRIRANLCSNTSLAHVKVTNLTALDEPTIEKTWGVGSVPGAISPNDDDVPQAAACITRKSFLRGRKSIGHVYYGPLPSIFTSEGIVVPDPTGTGDLNDVLDAFGDPLVDSSTGWSARPIVCNAAGSDVVANNDVRTQSIAFLTVYLKSRRQGIGE